jgi:Caspase domain/Sel1 repeat
MLSLLKKISRSGSLSLAKLALLAVTAAACTTAPVGQLGDYEIVDCELPGMILRIGAGLATTGRAQLVRTSSDDCSLRNGYSISNSRSSYETSLKTWSPLALEGDKQAQLFVGQIFEKGLGREPDFSKAAEWYKKAADQGFAPAQVALATILERGLVDGKPQPMIALELYRKAAQLTEPLVSAREVTQRETLLSERNRQIEELEKELQREREATLTRQKSIQEQGVRLNSEILSLQRSAQQAQLQNDALRARIAEQTLRERRLQAEQQVNMAAALQREVNRSNAALEGMKQPAAVVIDTGAPKIELIEPSTVQMRGVTTISVPGDQSNIEIIARVTTSDVVRSVVVNDVPVTLDSAGILKNRLLIKSRTTPVQIIAIDSRGRRGELTLVLAAADIVQSAAQSTAINKSAGANYALVIGNARYRHWDTLTTPISDARAVSQVLKTRYGYSVTLLENATRGQIFAQLAVLRKTLTENDNLLIYYAGHGTWDQANRNAYWVPVDGEKESLGNYISASDVTSWMQVLRARQVLLVVDACYSGVWTSPITKQAGAQPAESDRASWLLQRARMTSRRVMSSGGVQPVADTGAGRHSIFARQFLDALQKRTAPFEAQELFDEIRPAVTRAAIGIGEQQDPQYGLLRNANHVAGDFLLIPKS